MVDVGGQMHERSTWEAQFDDVLSVIYMISLADYNQYFNSKGGDNKLLNSIQLFHELCAVPKFKNTPFVILLNKVMCIYAHVICLLPFRLYIILYVLMCTLQSDIFKKRIAEVGLSVCFPKCDLSQEHNYDYCLKYIDRIFSSTKRESEARIYTYPTNATDTALIDNVFDKVTHALLTQGLAMAGMET